MAARKKAKNYGLGSKILVESSNYGLGSKIGKPKPKPSNWIEREGRKHMARIAAKKIMKKAAQKDMTQNTVKKIMKKAARKKVR